MPVQFTTSYLEESLALFRQYQKLAEGAMAQVTDEQLFAALDPEANSIAIIVKHMTGNMRSRWTDFLTTDGEKPDRHRDTEFEEPPATREALMQLWQAGWDCGFRGVRPAVDRRPRPPPHDPRRAPPRRRPDPAEHAIPAGRCRTRTSAAASRSAAKPTP